MFKLENKENTVLLLLLFTGFVSSCNKVTQEFVNEINLFSIQICSSQEFTANQFFMEGKEYWQIETSDGVDFIFTTKQNMSLLDFAKEYSQNLNYFNPDELVKDFEFNKNDNLIFPSGRLNHILETFQVRFAGLLMNASRLYLEVHNNHSSIVMIINPGQRLLQQVINQHNDLIQSFLNSKNNFKCVKKK